MDQEILHFAMKAAFYGHVAQKRDPFTKEAGGIADLLGRLRQGYGDLPPDVKAILMGGLVGAGAGAGLGGLSSMARPKNKRHLLRDALLGGVAGGALGGGLGYGAQGLGLLGGDSSERSMASWLAEKMYGPGKNVDGNLARQSQPQDLLSGNSVDQIMQSPQLALMAGSPSAMMAASNANAMSALQGQDSLTKAYNTYVKGQSPENIKNYFEHLINTNPAAADKIRDLYVADNGPTLASNTSDFVMTHPRTDAVLASGLLGGGIKGTQDFLELDRDIKNLAKRPFSERYKLWRATNPGALPGFEVDYSKQNLPWKGKGLQGGKGVGPSVGSQIGKQNDLDNAVFGRSGVSGLSKEMEHDIWRTAANGRPEDLNPKLTRLKPKVRPDTSGGYKFLGWGRAAPGKGEPFVSNSILQDVISHTPPKTRGLFPRGRAYAKGFGKGSLGGILAGSVAVGLNDLIRQGVPGLYKTLTSPVPASAPLP